MLQSVLMSVFLTTVPIKAIPRVEAASLFKNGFALVIRDIPIKGSAEYLIEDVPDACLGTLWIRAGDGVKVSQVNTEAIESSEDLASMDTLLDANVGQKVTLVLEGLPSVTETIISSKGTLVSIHREDGTKHAFPKGKVISVSGEKGLMTSIAIKGAKRALRIIVDAPKGGKLQLVSLERGLSWAPNYSIELTKDKKLRFIGKATVVNDLMNLESADLQLITGFPNVPYAELPDPLTHEKGLADFLGLIQQFEQKAANVGFGYVRPVSFGGGSRMGEISGASRGQEGVPVEPLLAERAEDMFYFKRAGVSLGKDERAYLQLFDAGADYEDLYTWDIDRARNDYWYYSYSLDMDRMNKEFLTDVWHSIRFKNPAGMPVSTAAAVITRDGRIAGQDMLKFTPNNGFVEAKLTKAMEVLASNKEEIVERTSSNGTTRIKGTVSLFNGKSEPVTIRIRKVIWGRFLDSTFQSAAGPRSYLAPSNVVEWTETLQPGQKSLRTYTYER